MSWEQKLQQRYGIPQSELNVIKKQITNALWSLMEVHDGRSNLSITDLRSVEQARAEIENAWEAACRELLDHPVKYTQIEKITFNSHVEMMAWGINTFIKARLEKAFKLDEKNSQQVLQLVGHKNDTGKLLKQNLEIDNLRLKVSQKQLELLELNSTLQQKELEQLVFYFNFKLKLAFTLLNRCKTVLLGILIGNLLFYSYTWMRYNYQFTKTKAELEQLLTPQNRLRVYPTPKIYK